MQDRLPKLFCFGYGYTCDYLGHALRRIGGWSLAGTTRNPERKEELLSQGIQAYIFDGYETLYDPGTMLDHTTHLLISTPPEDEGDPVFLMHAEDVLNMPTLQWVGYLSTTGVYGDRDGGWVDETSEIRPNSKRGSRRARAEEQWLSLFSTHGLPVHVFRLAGIYGPGRSALDSIRAGVARRIYKPGQMFGRIHVEDIVQTLLASFNRPNPGRIYNVCDDEPCASHEVISYACELLGVDPPPMVDFEDADLAPIARSFYSDNKRVSNERIKEELGVVLKCPDYREGLKACLQAEQAAHSRKTDDSSFFSKFV